MYKVFFLTVCLLLSPLMGNFGMAIGLGSASNAQTIEASWEWSSVLSNRMNIESALVEAHAKRATGGDARRYDAMYRAAVDETDNETKRLNERTEEVRNNFSQGVEAVEALKDLYRILDVKLRVTRRDMAGESLSLIHI